MLALLGFLFLLPLLFDVVWDLVALAVAVGLLAVASKALFSEGQPGSPWQRWRLEDRLSFLGETVGVLAMILAVGGLAVAFLVNENINGFVAMLVFVALIAAAFVPGVWRNRAKLIAPR